MKIPLKLPKVTNSSSSNMQQFLLMLLATTISIVLTFGTSAFLDKRKKEAEKKEMVMMIIYDFDKTIEQVQHIDSAFHLASKTEQEIALHPDYFDSLQPRFHPAMMIISTEFSETTENIFSSNIETFNTLGNVNFVHEVSSFYNMRHLYQNVVIDSYKQELSTYGVRSVESLFQIDFPEHYFTGKSFLKGMKVIRDRCMQMMNISEEELKEFSQQRMANNNTSEEDEIVEMQMIEEMREAEEIISRARERKTSVNP